MKEVHVTNVFIAPFKQHLILLAFLEGDEDELNNNNDNDDNKDNNNGFDVGITYCIKKRFTNK